MKKYLHVMIDLETLGIDYNALVTQIGAGLFDLDEGFIYDTFNESLNFKNLESINVNPDTLSFWVRNEHNSTMFKELLNNESGLDQRDLWVKFHDWLSEIVKNYSDHEIKIWGNGIMFDIGKVYANFAKYDLKMPTKYSSEFDLRTLAFLASQKTGHSEYGIKHLFPNSSAHDALSDVYWEIDFAVAMNKIINNSLTYDELSAFSENENLSNE